MDESIEGAEPSAPDATWPDTDPTVTEALNAEVNTRRESARTRRRTQRNDDGGSEPGESTQAEPTSSTELSTSIPPTNSPFSDEPLRGSNKRWRRQSSAKGLAAQMNAVGTMVLNGDLSIDVARVYAALARSTVQALSVQVTKSRFAREIPDIDLEDEELFDA